MKTIKNRNIFPGKKRLHLLH